MKTQSSSFLAAFWLVKSADDEHDENLVFKKLKVDVMGNLAIPVLTNKKAIAAGSELIMPKPPSVAKASAPSAPSAKRAKTK